MGAIKDPKFGPAMRDVLEHDENMFTKRIAAEVLGELLAELRRRTELAADLLITQTGERRVVPGMVADLVARFYDLAGRPRVLLDPLTRQEERALCSVRREGIQDLLDRLPIRPG